VPLVISLDVADLAATRFAASPLAETIKALQLLARPDPSAVNRPWVNWARRRLRPRPLRVPSVWPLVVTGLPTYPEFLMPAPSSRWPAFPDELARLAATPTRAVRASLRRVFGDGPWPDSASELLQRPTFDQIIAELTECHDRLVAPHWERIRSVLDADIAYRAGVLASGGASALFADMHPDRRWSAGTLTLADVDTAQSVVPVQLGPHSPRRTHRAPTLRPCRPLPDLRARPRTPRTDHAARDDTGPRAGNLIQRCALIAAVTRPAERRHDRRCGT
jgi:hypothetical protein